MELSRMSMGIIKIIEKQYSEFMDDDCLDIIRIKDICNLYKPKSKNKTSLSVSLSEIQFSSPQFKKINVKENRKKNQNEILVSEEFTKKYTFFIRIMYSCLKINVDIFNINSTIITIKNNYQLIKALDTRKKQLLVDHINILKLQHKNSTKEIDVNYETYCTNFLTKIKIIDKITGALHKLIKFGIFEKTDNLLTLILPYFYTYTDFIEEYNG